MGLATCSAVSVMLVDSHSHNSERLEQHRQGRLAAGKTRVQEADTRNDQEDEEGHDHQVDVMELQSSVLSVNILDVRVAAIGLRWVKFWLLTGQSSLDMLFTDATYSRWCLHIAQKMSVYRLRWNAQNVPRIKNETYKSLRADIWLSRHAFMPSR
jgi:hypothetical protein